jgi:hypothetical protein
MNVTLSHRRNPDIVGGYWQDPVESGRARKIACASLADASRICRDYIGRNGLGGGNWTGGKITDTSGKGTLGQVAYNGCIFGNDGKEIQP